jgi:endo-beta-N-acetylglucosaminidase D
VITLGVLLPGLDTGNGCGLAWQRCCRWPRWRHWPHRQAPPTPCRGGGQYADTSHPEQSAGANQPYQHGYTGLDILNWNPDADKDSEYLRSRVPLQTRIAANAATQKDPNLPADTEMFNLAGDYGNAFFESFHDNNVFSQYLFNYWQYTDYYGTWHGQPTANVPKSLYDEKAQSD